MESKLQNNISLYLLYTFQKTHNAIHCLAQIMTVSISEEEGMKINGIRERKMEDVNFIYIVLFIFFKSSICCRMLSFGDTPVQFIINHSLHLKIFFQMKYKRNTSIFDGLKLIFSSSLWDILNCTFSRNIFQI